MKPRSHGSRFGGVSTHFVAAILVVIVATGLVLIMQHRALNPRLGTSHRTGYRTRPMSPQVGSILPDTVYRQSSIVQLDLDRPRGIALGPNSDVYAVGDSHLLKYDNAGKLLSRVSLSAEPQAVCVAPDNTVYLGMRDHIEVFKSGDAAASAWVKFDGRAYITSVCTNGSKVWAADAGNRLVLQYDTRGKLIRTLGEKNASKNVRGLIIPSPHMDVAVDSKGSLWVANTGRHSLEQYAEDGSVTRFWGKAGGGLEGFSGCCNPSDFAFSPCDEFITLEKGLLRVKVFSPEGKLQGLVASGEEFKAGAGNSVASGAKGASNSHISLDLAAGQDCRVYVLDSKARCVRVFSPK